MRGKCERGYENANADGTGAKVFAGDGCSQGASFGPMARFHGMDRADVYINTRARVLLRRMCVKPADLTTHSPPKTCSRPRTATRPSRTLPLPPHNDDARPQAARCIPRRPHNPFPAEDLRSLPHSDTHSPNTSARPRSPDARPRSPEPRPQAARSIPRSDTLPLLPFRFGHKKNGTAQCMCDAECLGRPSLRSVIWVGEPHAVRRRCGALACRRGA